MRNRATKFRGNRLKVGGGRRSTFPLLGKIFGNTILYIRRASVQSDKEELLKHSYTGSHQQSHLFSYYD